MHPEHKLNDSPLPTGSTVPAELLRNLVADLLREARASVPTEFSVRGLGQKYLNGDNHASGLQEAAERLESLLASSGLSKFPKGVWQFACNEHGKTVYKGHFAAFERARQAAQKWARQHPEQNVCLTFHTFERIGMSAEISPAA